MRSGGQDGGSGSVLLTFVDVSLAGVGGQDIWRGAPLVQADAFQLEAMGTVNDTIQNGVAQGHVADDIVPASHRDLAGDQQRALVVAVVDDLQQVAPLFGGQRLGPPVVDDQQPCAFSAASIRGSRPSPRAIARSANSRGARL